PRNGGEGRGEGAYRAACCSPVLPSPSPSLRDGSPPSPASKRGRGQGGRRLSSLARALTRESNCETGLSINGAGSCESRGRLRLPGLVTSDHDVEDGEQLSHACDEGDFGELSLGQE